MTTLNAQSTTVQNAFVGSGCPTSDDVGGSDLKDVSAPENSEEPEPELTEVQKINDAEMLGTENAEMDTLLEKPFVFMTGDMYGQRDRRNTLDGKWKRVEMPLADWIVGGDGWGLSRHPVGRDKEGASIVLADAIDGARKDTAIKTMYAVGIDIDSGAQLDDVIVKLEELDLLALVYTSYNHGKSELVLKHDDVMRKMKLEDTPNRTQVQEYLREHHKDRFDQDFIRNIKIIQSRKQTVDGTRMVIETPALDKFRVILPLWEPVELATLGTTVSQWKGAWANIVTGVAVNMLDVNFDATSCDVNRLFFTPRHRKGDDEWYSCVVRGKPLRFEDIEPHSKAKYVAMRTPGDPFTMGTGDHGGGEVYTMPSGKDLGDWHCKAKERFLLADVLETYCPDRIRVAGGEKIGTVHIECPFEHGHSSTGGTATMAMNALDSDSEYWTCFCHHDSCQGRHKLEFLQEMLAQKWFPEDVVFDETFVLPPTDQDIEPVALKMEEVAGAIDAAGIDKDSTDADVTNFLRQHLDSDATTRNRINDALGTARGSDGATTLKQTQIAKIWKELETQRACEELEAESERRANMKTPDYVPPEEATAQTVHMAAEAADWLPGGFTHQCEWFGVMDYESVPPKFKPVSREFEVVYCADGSKGNTRTNQLTAR